MQSRADPIEAPSSSPPQLVFLYRCETPKRLRGIIGRGEKAEKDFHSRSSAVLPNRLVLDQFQELGEAVPAGMSQFLVGLPPLTAPAIRFISRSLALVGPFFPALALPRTTFLPRWGMVHPPLSAVDRYSGRAISARQGPFGVKGPLNDRREPAPAEHGGGRDHARDQWHQVGRRPVTRRSAYSRCRRSKDALPDAFSGRAVRDAPAF